MKQPTHVHFIGISGSGVSAAAKMTMEMGIAVSGSDRSFYAVVEKLRAIGAIITIGEHCAENVHLDTELVVASNAVFDINPNNPELVAARERGIPILRYPEYIGQHLARGKRIIAIAGTHGKTTTTAMTVLAFRALGLSPSFIIGGEVKELGGNAALGAGDIFIVEACEYQHSFLNYQPESILLTNIDHDHVDCYDTFDDVVAVFSQFVETLPLEGKGVLVLCGDDQGNQTLLAMDHLREKTYPCITYGLEGEKNDVSVSEVAFDAGKPRFVPRMPDKVLAPVDLAVHGEHNLLNALGVVALCEHYAPGESATVAEALASFHGTKRRMDHLGTKPNGVKVYDDYAHHPTALRYTLAALRQKEEQHLAEHRGRLICVYQPHTYSRTAALINDFAQSFDDADLVLVPTIMGAREQDPGTISSSMVVDRINQHYGEGKAIFTPEFSDIVDWLEKHAHMGDVVVTTSCGDIWRAAEMYLDK